MRSLSNATCTSEEPVSLGCVLKRSIKVDLDSRVTGIRHSPRSSRVLFFISTLRLTRRLPFGKSKNGQVLKHLVQDSLSPQLQGGGDPPQGPVSRGPRRATIPS